MGIFPGRYIKPVYLVLANVGAFPGSVCDTGKIYSGRSARAAGILFVAGVGVHPAYISS
jgi:hypothetical protein